MRLFLVESEELDVWGQLALDEWMLDRAGGDVFLRFHSWTGGPAASFGYAQRHAPAVAELPPHLRANCARRLTGGGLLRHGADVTFSCVFPYSRAAWNPLGAFRILHEAIGRAFQEAGFDVCLVAAPVERPARRGFRVPVLLDVMGLDGELMVRGAFRKRRGSVLYEGSVRMDGARSRADSIVAAVQYGLETAIHRADWEPYPWKPDGEFARLREKYRAPAWLERW